jgi:hypothetical protein
MGGSAEMSLVPSCEVFDPMSLSFISLRSFLSLGKIRHEVKDSVASKGCSLTKPINRPLLDQFCEPQLRLASGGFVVRGARVGS